jgi:hypothetical protein
LPKCYLISCGRSDIAPADRPLGHTTDTRIATRSSGLPRIPGTGAATVACCPNALVLLAGTVILELVAPSE